MRKYLKPLSEFHDTYKRHTNTPICTPATNAMLLRQKKIYKYIYIFKKGFLVMTDPSYPISSFVINQISLFEKLSKHNFNLINL